MANLRPVRYAWHELRHGWRHFLIFLACLILGVAVMAGVVTIGAAINQALNGESRALLGGDVELTLTGTESNAQEKAFFARYGRVSQVSTLRAMAHFGDTPLLVEAKAVDVAYPLLGNLLSDSQESPQNVLIRGEALVDAALLAQLGAKIGDRLQIGAGEYRIGGVISKEPDRTVQIFAFGPRVLLSREALAKSGLLTPFSLVRHHTRIALHEGVKQETFLAELKAAFSEPSWRIKTTTDGNQSVRRFVDRLEMFLTLSALATFLIAGIGIGSSVHGYLERKLTSLAVFKILGASQAFLLRKYLLLLGLLALIGSFFGLVLSASGVAALLPFIAQWLPVESGKWLDWQGIGAAFGFSLLIVYAFSLPALLTALQVKPALLFRGGVLHSLLLRPSRRLLALEALLVAGILVLLLTIARDAAVVLGGAGVAALAFFLFLAASRLLRKAAARIPARTAWLRLALGNIARPGSAGGTVVLAIGISLMVLVALALVEANFQTRIREITETEAPSLFMMDIQPDQVEKLVAMLQQTAGSPDRVMMHPMVRGRIQAIDGVPVAIERVAEDVRWAIRGDRGLSYSASPPANGEIVAGKWWPEDYTGPPLVSVDERFLDGMGLKIGSRLTLNILGEDITATVASARRIDYSSFQMNFAVILSPGLLESYPQTYLATVHLPPAMIADHDDIALMREIAKAFPNVATIRTREAVELVRGIIGHIAAALRLTVCITLAAGLLVLMSALGAMLGERLYETAVFKVLGARRGDILKAYSAEWLLLGLVTASIAALTGTLCAWLAMQRLPGEHFRLMPEVTLLTIFGSLSVVWLVGYFANRKIFAIRPAGFLRNE